MATLPGTDCFQNSQSIAGPNHDDSVKLQNGLDGSDVIFSRMRYLEGRISDLVFTHLNPLFAIRVEEQLVLSSSTSISTSTAAISHGY